MKAIWDVWVLQYVIIIIIIIIIIINPLNAVVIIRTTFPNINKNYVSPSKYVCVSFILTINGDYVIMQHSNQLVLCTVWNRDWILNII